MRPKIRLLPDRPGRIAKVAVNAGFAVALLFGVLGFAVPAAFAQDEQVKSLIDRIDRLQREMSTLQRQVYRGEAPPAAATDAPAGAGGLSGTAGARIELRLSQLETELRTLTGQVEEATFGFNQLHERLDRLSADIDLRLQRLEQGAPAVAGGQGAPGAQVASTGSSSTFDTAPKVLGTINPNDLQALQTQRVEQMSPSAQAPGQAKAAIQGEAGGQQTANLIYPLAGETPEERYRHAFGLLSQANYGEAELALRAFLSQHPKSPLAGNAKYWLGETYYVRQDFQQAAVTFAEAFQEFPDNSKAPDNLLKLGMSLAALGNKSDACGTFSEVLKRYPEAAVTVIRRAKQERQRLTCS